MTLFVDPGGVAVNVLEVNGSSGSPTGSGVVISPLFFLATLFFNPLMFDGGLSDLFCAKPVQDTFYAVPVPDTFIVPPGKTSC